MLGGWFGRQALKRFLGAIDFTAPEASGQTKNAYKLSFTLVCPQDLISGHLDRFLPRIVPIWKDVVVLFGHEPR
jgi:hypothetical protein